MLYFNYGVLNDSVYHAYADDPLAGSLVKIMSWCGYLGLLIVCVAMKSDQYQRLSEEIFTTLVSHLPQRELMKLRLLVSQCDEGSRDFTAAGFVIVVPQLFLVFLSFAIDYYILCEQNMIYLREVTGITDVKKSWETSDPDFSLCFEKTVLVWTPCLVLWLLSPLELWLIYTSKCRDIPWGLTNIVKLLLNLSLITVSIVSLSWSAVRYFQDDQVFLLDLWTPAIQTITFMLAAVLLILDKVRGLHTSGVLFVFWLLLGIAGAAQFRTEILRDSTTESEEENFKYILYMIYYPIVLLMLVLNLFADPPPRSTDYPKYQKLCPEVQASFISKIIFGWFEPLIYKGFRKPLTVSDLWDLRYKDTSSQIVPRFEKNWKKKLDYSTRTKSKTILGENPPAKESETKPVSVLGPLFKTFWLPIVASGFTKVLSDALVFINPQILNLMISFVAGKDYLWKGFVYAAAMFLAAEMQTILTQNTFMNMYNVGINWRTSLMSSIYKKALRVSSAARKSSTVGEVVNLMAVDAQRCSDFAQFIHFIWTAPIIIVVALYFLWQILGVAVLAGLAVMIVIIPFNGVIANKMKKLQTKQMKYKDERVKLINEILTGIKVLVT
ncbi:multidrug resistance-associated protein 1-like, partial [Homalodisca vitripennis]|uniref:multidrug resistance-associated protein 1-like n=1 Tax=Homalodisca vitripennis TaxID=197043 RepID=UPI001EEAA2CC